MVSLAKLPRIRQGIGEKYKNIGLEKFRLSMGSIQKINYNLYGDTKKSNIITR
jgi:hypothetical protein